VLLMTPHHRADKIFGGGGEKAAPIFLHSSAGSQGTCADPFAPRLWHKISMTKGDRAFHAD
jgi:hypothetical protein